MSVRNNVIANLGGRLWASLMALAFIPFYIRMLGTEAYGLIGFFAAMLAMFAVLDLGLGLTVNRELARMSGVPSAVEQARILLRTLECVYWVIGALVGLTLIFSAPLIASHWLQARSLFPETIQTAVQLMGIVAIFRWPVSLYIGALQGLQQQVRLNLIVAFGATLAGGGAMLALLLVSADIKVFFGWQVVAAAMQLALLRWAAWRALRLEGHRPIVLLRVLRETWRFSAGITLISILSIVLTQLDKLVLSWLLPLASFGYYTLAGSIASVLMVAGATVESATFPALARLQAAGRTTEISTLYHQSSQALALLVVPLASILAMFAPELLALYLHDAGVVAHTHLLLSLLVVGNAILAIMFMPLSLQLAYGWTRLSLYKNILAVILFVPALFVMVGRFGPLGAASVWIALTIGYLVVEVQVMHRRLLPGEQWRWYVEDVGLPVAISLLVAGAARFALPAGWSGSAQLLLIAFAGAIAIAASAMAMRGPRRALLAAGRRLRFT